MSPQQWSESHSSDYLRTLFSLRYSLSPLYTKLLSSTSFFSLDLLYFLKIKNYSSKVSFLFIAISTSLLYKVHVLFPSNLWSFTFLIPNFSNLSLFSSSPNTQYKLLSPPWCQMKERFSRIFSFWSFNNTWQCYYLLSFKQKELFAFIFL